MGYKLILISIVLVSMTGCYESDMKGMFVGDRSSNERFSDSQTYNNTHPFMDLLSPTESYTILGFADSHLGPTAHLDQMIEDGIDMGAVAVLMAGDLSSGHEKDYQIFEEHLPHPDTLMTFPIAGNHDLYFEGWEHFYHRFGTSTFYFTVTTPSTSDLYVALESGGGTLGSLQLEWLKEVLLTERPNHRKCVIVTHNNLFRFHRTGSTNPQIEELYVLMELFTKHDVNMVITGHDHLRSENTFGLTTHITMDALKDEASNASYLKLDLVDGELVSSFTVL